MAGITVTRRGFAEVEVLGPGVVSSVSQNSPILFVEAFGARGDGSADDTAAIQAAINSLPQPGSSSISGGRLTFKKGKTYKITSSLVCDGLVNVTLDGGSGGTHGGAQLNAAFTAGSSSPIVSAKSALSFTITGGLCLTNSDTTYTGVGVELSKGTGSNTDRAKLERTRIDLAQNVSCTAIGVSLQNAQACEIDDCWITGGNYAIQGLKTASDFSNGIVVRKNYFQYQNVAAIHNAGAAWKITDENIFEPLLGGTVAGALFQDATVPAQSLDYSGNWHGDATTGTWIVANGSNVKITGNQIATATTGIQINATTNGLTVIGNRFNNQTTAIDLNGQSMSDAAILGNRFLVITTKITTASGGAYGTGSVVSDGTGLVSATLNGTTTLGGNSTNNGSLFVFNGAASSVFTTEASGDTNARFQMLTSGSMVWGPGNTATDVGPLSRQSANYLGLAAADLGVVTAGRGVRVKEGSNAKQGVATLAAGTVTVSNTSVTANSRIILTAQDNNTTGALRVSARTAATSFVITSSNGADTGVVAYQIFEPA